MVVPVLLAGLLGGLLTGCSDDPFEAYCETVEEHQTALTEAIAEGGPDALISVLPQLRDLRDASPSDVAADWQQVVGRLSDLAEALEAAGVDPAAYDEDDPPADLTDEQRLAIEVAARELAREDTVLAFRTVSTQVRDVCQTPLYR